MIYMVQLQSLTFEIMGEGVHLHRKRFFKIKTTVV